MAGAWHCFSTALLCVGLDTLKLHALNILQLNDDDTCLCCYDSHVYIMSLIEPRRRRRAPAGHPAVRGARGAATLHAPAAGGQRQWQAGARCGLYHVLHNRTRNTTCRHLVARLTLAPCTAQDFYAVVHCKRVICSLSPGAGTSLQVPPTRLAPAARGYTLLVMAQPPGEVAEGSFHLVLTSDRPLGALKEISSDKVYPFTGTYAANRACVLCRCASAGVGVFGLHYSFHCLMSAAMCFRAQRCGRTRLGAPGHSDNLVDHIAAPRCVPNGCLLTPSPPPPALTTAGTPSRPRCLRSWPCSPRCSPACRSS